MEISSTYENNQGVTYNAGRVRRKPIKEEKKKEKDIRRRQALHHSGGRTQEKTGNLKIGKGRRQTIRAASMEKRNQP